MTEELYIHKVWDIQNAVTLLIRQVELNRFDPVIDLNVGGLSLLEYGLDLSAPEDVRPRRHDSQADL